jgi:hypothetical protein
MPEVGLHKRVVLYANDLVVAATKESHGDFEGTLGLPFLREVRYGGDDEYFWIEPLRVDLP